MADNPAQDAGTSSTAPIPPFFQEPENGALGMQTAYYQSITASREHLRTSFEELRLKDYACGQGVVVRPKSSSAFGPPPGLVNASLPPLCRECQIPFTSKASTIPGSNPFASRAITVRVGRDEPRNFIVHEALITARSEFVRTALKKDWKEGNEGILPLPEDDIDSFNLYHQWLYTGLIFLNRLANTARDISKDYELLVKAYLIGEKLIDADFKDTIIDCIIDKLRSSRTFDARLTNLVYDNTPTQSPLRHLWLDIYVHTGSPNWLDEKALGDFVNSDFAVDLGKAHMRVRQGVGLGHPLFMGNSCAYHEHGDGSCYRRRV